MKDIRLYRPPTIVFVGGTSTTVFVVRPDWPMLALLYLDIIVLTDTLLTFSRLGVSTYSTPNYAWFWLIPLVTAAGSWIAGRHQAKKQEKANQAAMLQQHQMSQDLWKQQNEYNTPSAQMDRYKDAGLNPNLIYGQGNSGNAGPPPTPSVADRPVGPALQLPAMLAAYQDFRMREAQIDNVRAQTQMSNSRLLTEGMRRSMLDLGMRTGEFDLQRREYLAPYEAAITGNRARASEALLQQEFQKLRLMSNTEQQQLLDQMYSKQKMEATDIDIERRKADLMFQRFRNQWAQYGITSSDNIIFRILVRMMTESGLSALGK